MSDLLESKKKEVYYFNVLNIISCLGVVMLHCNVIFWSHPTGNLWITSNIIETVMYFPVAIFFMLSGVTLLDYRKRYSTLTYLKKRFVKTVIPFLIWSCIAGVFMIYLSRINNIPFDYSYKAILSNIIHTKYNTVYWFFIPLFYIYLSMPIISLIPKNRRLYGLIILIGFTTCSVLPMVFNFFNVNYNNLIKAPFLGGYLLYVFIGYYLANFKISKKQRIIIYLLAIAGLALHFFGTVILTPENGAINRTFKGYLNFPAVLYSTGVFVFFKYSNYSKLKMIISETTIASISKYSFGIYLIHMFYIQFFDLSFDVDTSSLEWRTIGAVLIYLLSLATAVLIKRMPLFKNILP